MSESTFISPRNYWAHYLEQNGGNPGVSEKLGIPVVTITSISNGTRGIGRNLAKRMVSADPMLDIGRLLQVEATKQVA